MPSIFAVATIAIFLALGGCKTAPQRNSQDIGPAMLPRWHANNAPPESAPANWVGTFGDSGLSSLVQTALAENYEIKAVAARVKTAVAQARIDGAARWPQLFLVPGYQYAQIRETGFGPARFGVFEALFGLSWELDVWGRIADFQEAAIKEADATAADFYGARLSLAARVAQSYFELSEAKLQTQVAEQSVKDRSVIVDLVRGRFARGLTKALDLRLALTDLANAEAQLAESRNQMQLIARRLEVLLGRYPAGEVVADSELPEPPPGLPAGLPSELLERRPDIIAAFDRVRSADFRLASTRKLLLPRVTLTAAGGVRSTALTDLVDPRALAWNVLVGLAQPIFTGGRIQGEIHLNKARVEQAVNLYKNTALNAFREVEQILAADEWLRTEEEALRKAVEQTEASRKLAVYSYQHGFIEILTLLDSYRSTLIAQSAHLSVRRQLLTNRVNLFLALGGGV